MKLAIIDRTGKKVSDMEFTLNDVIREDIFKKAYLAEQSLFRQSKGADVEAGKKSAIHLSKRRKKRRTTYGRGEARTPRKVMWARGMQLRYVGAFSPNTVGGRRAHPPKAEKKILKTVNNKEWELALRSGILSSFDKNIVVSNGQMVPENYPFVFDGSVEEISKTKDFISLLQQLGFESEIDRVSKKKIRAGKGTKRNRTYKLKRGPLVVVSSVEKPLLKACRNLRGFDVVTTDLLLVSDFGMSEKPGRAVIFTKDALEEFKEAVGY